MEFVSTISTNVHTHAHKDCTYILHYIVDAIPHFGPSHLLFCTQRLYMRDLIGPLLFVSLMTVSLRIFAFKQVRPWKVNSVELWGYDARRMTVLGVLCHDIGDIWPKGSAMGSLTASGSDTEPIVGRRVIRSYQIRTLERRPADQTPPPLTPEQCHLPETLLGTHWRCSTFQALSTKTSCNAAFHFYLLEVNISRWSSKH